MKTEDIKNLLSDVQRPKIFEIGANNGTNTVEFLKQMPTSLITCFEPDPRAFEQLLANDVVGTGITTGRVDALPLAICDHDGIVPFYPSSGTFPGEGHNQWNKSGSLLKPKEHLKAYPWCRFDRKDSAIGVRLDTFMRGRPTCCPKGKIDFVWADVQGAELLMIAGGEKTFKNNVHFLYTEYSKVELYEGSPGIDAILALLPGYDVILDTGGDVLLCNRRFTYNHEDIQ
jgi:2-O-methyltransferase